MRNLQKILALVLALVMSLSLMATAGAEFTDQADIDETFAESVDVLNGLEVFQGYPTGDFQPKGEITRAEVAVIIYRIATGDVDDTQVGIYADYNKFSDVYASEPISGWAAGYINYCANAEYIKGRGDGKFDPTGKVTGYEALAMILRVVGYDKNGEFTGADWQVQTAAIANQQKVTKNVNAGLLGQAATREMVAELLCQAILIPTVNYTLAYGYQQSTNPQDTIAYQTFKMEKLEGVVTGNEIADLKNESPMAAGQTRLVIDGREETMNFTTGLESIGKSVRAYIRPQNGTTNKQLVPGKVYDTEKNHVYDSFAKVSTVGNSTGSSDGITSIEGAEHFINYGYADRWTANIRITYTMDMKWTEYDAKTMRRDNGGKLYPYVKNADMATRSDEITGITSSSDTTKWSTLLTSDADYTYTYTKTIALNEELTQQDWDNLLSIFTNADRINNNSTWLVGEVYVGTASFNAQDDISDEIRWTDFVNTYLVNQETRQQVKSNGLGNRLIIIDNDDDGIAEYVLQTIYTIAKVSSDAKNVDIINTKLYDSSNSDAVNSTLTSNTLVSVSGKELAASEEALAAGDVVIYALIDGNIRAQKAETKTEKVNTVNRADKTITVVGEDAATYKESAVHTHSAGLKSYVANMAGNTNYTMYFDLDGNLAAFTEGANGGLVLITNGWYNSTITGSEYAIQAYVDGALQTVNVGTSGSLFVGRYTSGNSWNNLRSDFGPKYDAAKNVVGYTINNEDELNRNDGVHTIVANLDGNTVTPVDKAYLYSQNLRVLDMNGNEIPNQNNWDKSWGIPYETVYGNTTLNPSVDNVAYNTPGDSNASASAKADGSYEVRGLSNTVYYVVYNAHGTDPMTTGQNVVVRTYTGYSNVPTLNKDHIEDVYVVGARATANDGTPNGITYYTAQVVVIEMNDNYNHSASEQVFVPDFSEVGNSVGIEYVTMIRGNGNKEQVKVDLGNSDYFNGYDPAGSNNTSNAYGRERRPGLYFMDPSDTDPEVFVLQRMTPDDIRDNNYLVGYVREGASGTGGTLPNNYPQIEKLVRPDGFGLGWWDDFGNGSTGLATAQKTYPKQPTVSDVKYYGRAVNETKAYTYGGTTATLVEADVYNVLAQTRHDIDGTNQDVNGLNERWDALAPWTDASKGEAAPSYHFPNANRNEVLVRYSGNKIVWAVSFNETSNLNAQRVWWNCLPSDGVSTPDDAPVVTFYNQPVGAPDANKNYSLTIPYATALANAALDPSAISVEGGNVVPGSQTATALADGGNTYKGTIRISDGTYYTYELIQSGKLAVGPLKSSNEALVEITGLDTWEVIDPDKLSVASLKEILSAENAEIKIEAKDSNGKVISEDSTDTMVGQCSTLIVYKVAQSDGTRTATTRGTTITTHAITFNPAQVTVKVGSTAIANGQKVKNGVTLTIDAKTGYRIDSTSGFASDVSASANLTTATVTVNGADASITSVALSTSKITYNSAHVTVVISSDNAANGVADSGDAGTVIASGSSVYQGTLLRVTAKTGYELSSNASAGGSGGYDDAAYQGSAYLTGGTLKVPVADFEIKSQAKAGYTPAVIAAVDALEAKDTTYFKVFTNSAAVSTTEHEAYNNKADVAVNSETFWASSNDVIPVSALSKKVLEPMGFTTSSSAISKGASTLLSGTAGEDSCVWECTATVAILNKADKSDTGARATIKYQLVFCDVNVQTHLNEAEQWIIANRNLMTNGWDSTFNTAFENANPHVTTKPGTFKMTANSTGGYTCTVTVASKGNASKTLDVQWNVAA